MLTTGAKYLNSFITKMCRLVIWWMLTLVSCKQASQTIKIAPAEQHQIYHS